MAEEKDTRDARALAQAGREHEARREYHQALKCYEQSLKLEDDAEVQEAYFRILAAVGPV